MKFFFAQGVLLHVTISWLVNGVTKAETEKSMSYALYQRGVHYQYSIGDIQAAMKEYQEADRSITAWDRENFDFTGMYNDLGVFYFRMREYDLAQQAYENVLYQNPQHLNAIANLATLKASLGDIEGADLLYLKGSQLEKVPLAFMHNYGVHSLNTGRKEASLIIFNQNLATQSSFYQSRTEIAKQMCMQDKMHDTYAHLELALADAADANDMPYFWQTYFVYVTSTPTLFPTLEYMETFRSFYLHNLYEAMTLMPKNAILRPEENMGCSYVGYYLIYQGYVDLIPRQLHSSLFMHVSGATLRPPTVTCPSLVEEAGEMGKATVAAADDKISVGFLGNFCNHGGPEHSVTLLTAGVMQHLNPSDFRVRLIAVAGNMPDEMCRQSYDFAEVVILPKFSVSPSQALQNILDLSLDVLVFTEIGMVHDIYFLAHSRLAKRTLSFWGHAITSGIVDYAHLIAKERGEWSASGGAREESQSSQQRGGPDYFISSVLFEKCNEGIKKDTFCPEGAQHQHQHQHQRCFSRSGGDSNGNQCYSMAQQKYSERLLLQEGMTTYFLPPPLPLTWQEIDTIMPAPTSREHAFSDNRIPLLPDKLHFLAYFLSSGGQTYGENIIHLRHVLATYGISEHNIRLYCIPQTLYKLSPGNIDIIKQLLVADPSGILVLLDGESSRPEQKQLIINAFPSSSLARILFLQKLKQREYMTLLAVSDVVLDTFPVGGGRSSFAIFSTGTPIVMLYPNTSILQLTYAMYQTMGIDCSMCITYDEETYIASSIDIASNKTLQRSLRRDILKYKSRLFENKTVVEEWEHMIKYVLSEPRPMPFETNSGTDLKSSLSIFNAGAADSVNYLQDLKRIYESSNNSSNTNSDVIFDDWVKDLPLDISLALSVPYSAPPIRLSSVRTTRRRTSNMEDTVTSKEGIGGGFQAARDTSAESFSGAKKPDNDNNNKSIHSDYQVASYEKNGMSLGVILMDDGSTHSQTSQHKLQTFKETILSLEVAMGLNKEEQEQFPSGNIKEVIVVDDGTAGMSVQDRALFSAAFPNFHFIFERSKSNMSRNKKKSWYQLKALSSLIKMSQYRYLFIIPSNLNAASYPFLCPPLLEASHTFMSAAKSVPTATTTTTTSTSFSFILRFALQLLNGYTNVTGSVDGFPLEHTSTAGTLPAQEQVFRQAAHIVLLNTLAIEKNLEGLEVKKVPLSDDANCVRPDVGVVGQVTDGSHLLVGKCRKGREHSLPFVELHADETTSPAAAAAAAATPRYLDVNRSPYCACSVANETYLKQSTYFGGFVDEDIRDICSQNFKLKGRSFLSRMDRTVFQSYRDFTCLLAVFSPEARQQMKLRQDEVKYFQRIQEFYLQPSLWDVKAVSLLIQGLEKEYILGVEGWVGGGTTRASTRFRHKPKPPTTASASVPSEEKEKKNRRKKSLVKRSGRVDSVFHARGEVVFDKSDLFERQLNDNTDDSDSSKQSSLSSMCQYINTTAISENTGLGDNNDDIFQCKNKNKNSNIHSSIRSSTRFVQRLLSSGVKVAYLSGELFGNKK